MNTPAPSASPSEGRREILVALAALFAGTGLLALSHALMPAISGWLQALLALLLLALPGWVLRRSETRIDDLGVHMGPWPRSLGLFAVAALVIFPLFTAGFHLVQTRWLGQESVWSADRLARWDRELMDYPGSVCESRRDKTQSWIDSSGLWLLGPQGTAVTVSGDLGRVRRVHCDPVRGPLATSALRPDSNGRLKIPSGEGVWLDLTDRQALSLNITTGGAAPLPSSDILLGAYGETPDEDGLISGHRGLGWLIPYIIIQLGLVALPEEWFFRGYLQPRIDQQMGTPWRLLGVSFGPGLILSAAAFALLHPILLPGFHRLLVFFPALLFGWLRARSGNIGAAVLMHAACNLLLEVLTGMYG
ncbi:MAG: MrtP family glutamic-type intramembrane protease [Myxococcota bacterium]|nr:MrtP family glutamic-type intramembrane protease [Myxococcota bacterium]